MICVSTLNDLVNHILFRNNSIGVPIDLPRLQAILYGIQRYCIVNYGIPAFMDDFYAYPFGPSIPAVLEAFNNMVMMYPTLPAPRVDMFYDKIANSGNINRNIVESIDYLIESMSTMDFEALCIHIDYKGMPWKIAIQNSYNSPAIIDKEMICSCM